MRQVTQIAARFRPGADSATISAHGNGNINDTFLVRPQDSAPFILQRLNPVVFSSPDEVMANLRLVCDHARNRLARSMPELRGWIVPEPLPTTEGQHLFRDAEGNGWRAMGYISDCISFDVLSDTNQALETGRGLGAFHLLLSDLDTSQLADTLPGFHHLPGYLRRYDEVRGDVPLPRATEAGFCAAFIAARRNTATLLEEAREAGVLKVRAIHGDPKLNNFLFAPRSGLPVALIDLDTVMAGLIHYDIGDCLRSACNPLGEEATPWQAVRFDLGRCRALLAGYAATAGPMLTPADYDYLYDAIRLIPFELGLRFFTDFLAGDTYFKTTRPGQNLDRALVQFRLCLSVEEQEFGLRTAIEALR